VTAFIFGSEQETLAEDIIEVVIVRIIRIIGAHSRDTPIVTTRIPILHPQSILPQSTVSIALQIHPSILALQPRIEQVPIRIIGMVLFQHPQRISLSVVTTKALAFDINDRVPKVFQGIATRILLAAILHGIEQVRPRQIAHGKVFRVGIAVDAVQHSVGPRRIHVGIPLVVQSVRLAIVDDARRRELVAAFVLGDEQIALAEQIVEVVLVGVVGIVLARSVGLVSAGIFVVGVPERRFFRSQPLLPQSAMFGDRPRRHARGHVRGRASRRRTRGRIHPARFVDDVGIRGATLPLGIE